MPYNINMIAVVIVLGIVCLLLAGFVVWQQLQGKNENGSNMMLKADLTELNKNVTQLQVGLQKQLNDQLGASNKQLASQSAASIKILQEVTEKLTKLEGTNKNVGDIASELKTLQNVLQNPKQRGVIGEFYLEQILKNVLPPGTFQLQFKLGEGLIVDAVIKIDDKLLPLDSKFPLANYNRLLEAKDADKVMLTRSFKEDVKKRVDETAKYIKPGKGTLDQALMFIPSEAIYYDLLANKVGIGDVSGRNLMQYAVEKKVTIVGPSTLSAMLQTIGQGLRSIEIHKDTEKIRKNIEQLQKHLISHNSYMLKLGNSLGAAVGNYNTTYKELGKIDRDIVKIADTEAQIEPLLLDRPTIED